MTLAEIEVLLKQLQEQIKQNTTAINTLHDNLNKYATTDDLKALSTQVNILLKNNDILQDSVAALDTRVSKIDHLQTLLDVDVNNLTENDILQYSNNGKWQNIQPSELKGIVNNNTGIDPDILNKLSLNQLSDVMINNLINGQVLQYDYQLGYWVNKTIKNNEPSNLDNYMTFEDAKRLYLPLTGGTLTGPLVVKAMVTVEDNVLVHKALTMYDN